MSIPFAIIRKESFEIENIEGLLFGTAGLLEADNEDNYPKDLKFRYYYLLHKYQLEKKNLPPLQFFKHRPDNFPTIRLSQLAQLYHSHQNLFSKIQQLKSIKSVYQLLQINASTYWQDHYQFDKPSPKKAKKLSKGFIDLLIINTIIPLQFAYTKSLGQEISESLIELLSEVLPEKNSIIDKFSSQGIKAQNAFETQSLIQLKNEYCAKQRCLDCAIGIELLKNIT
ncbi:MAG: hypothetical protein QG594_1050 [Bacteroidota bacterium]|nr:hypothetical protein [Bacteroidota bacterium]